MQYIDCGGADGHLKLFNKPGELNGEALKNLEARDEKELEEYR